MYWFNVADLSGLLSIILRSGDLRHKFTVRTRHTMEKISFLKFFTQRLTKFSIFMLQFHCVQTIKSVFDLRFTMVTGLH